MTAMIAKPDASRAAAKPRRRAPYKRRAASAGVGLIEVLIAVLVMAIGALGIAAMQAAALRNSQSALERSQAVIHSYAMFDAMRANLTAARNGDYDTGAPVCVEPTATGSLVATDQKRWIGALHESLGDTSCGQVVCEPIPGSVASDCTITVQWNDTRGTKGEEEQQITTRTRI